MNRVANTYVHALEGRLRINLPKIKRAERLALEVELRLQHVNGVERVCANPTTGNVLIHYNPQVVRQGKIISFLIGLGYLPQSLEGIGITDSASTLERLVSVMAGTLIEAVLSKLVLAVI